MARSRSLFSAPALLWASELKYYYSAVIKLQHVKFKSLASPSENTKDCIHTKHPNMCFSSQKHHSASRRSEKISLNKRFTSPSPPSYLLYFLLLMIVLLHLLQRLKWKWISSCSINISERSLVVKTTVNLRRRSKFIRVVDECQRGGLRNDSSESTSTAVPVTILDIFRDSSRHFDGFLKCLCAWTQPEHRHTQTANLHVSEFRLLQQKHWLLPATRGK